MNAPSGGTVKLGKTKQKKNSVTDERFLGDGDRVGARKKKKKKERRRQGGEEKEEERKGKKKGRRSARAFHGGGGGGQRRPPLGVGLSWCPTVGGSAHAAVAPAPPSV